jgi:hypothetical protein
VALGLNSLETPDIKHKKACGESPAVDEEQCIFYLKFWHLTMKMTSLTLMKLGYFLNVCQTKLSVSKKESVTVISSLSKE